MQTTESDQTSRGYTGIWERLANALRRVMESIGVDSEEAKRNICQAIADGAVKIRCRLEQHSTRFTTSSAVLEGAAFQIPPSISAGDFDWDNSRPKKPWFVERGAYAWPGYWHLAWLEVSKSDITAVICGPQQSPLRDPPHGGSSEIPGADSKSVEAPVRPSQARSRGPQPTKLNRTKKAMQTDIGTNFTRADLEGMPEKTLADRYHVSRDTARKARKAVLSELKLRQTPTNDK